MFLRLCLTSRAGLKSCPQVLARSPGVNLPKWQLTGGTSWNPCGKTSGSINLQWDQCSEFLIKPVSFINLQERQWFIRRASIWSRKWNSFYKPVSVVQINWSWYFPISCSASQWSFNLIVLLPSIHLKAPAGSLCLVKIVSVQVRWSSWALRLGFRMTAVGDGQGMSCAQRGRSWRFESPLAGSWAGGEPSGHGESVQMQVSRPHPSPDNQYLGE